MSNHKVDINMSIHEIPFDCTMPDKTYTNAEKTDKQIIPKKRTTVRKRKKKSPRAYCNICMKYFATQGSRKTHMMNIHHDNENEQTNFFNITHLNSCQSNSIPNKCQIKINKQSTNSTLPLNDSCTGPLDNPIESNKIHMDVSEKVGKSVPKRRTSKRKNKSSSSTYCKICKKNYSTPKSCKTHIKDYHGNTVSNKCEVEITKLFRKSLNPSTKLNPNNILKEVKENQNKTKNQMKRKNNKIYSCSICKNKFSTIKLYKIHMSSCHGNEVSKQLAINKPFKNYLPQIKSIEGVNEDLWIKNEIFKEFENKMPLEFLHNNEKFRCNVCNAITTDLIDFMDHEKMHYQNVEIKYDMFGKIICNRCQCVFTVLDYEGHRYEDCTNIDYKISKLHNTVPIQIDQIKNEDHDLLPDDSKIIVLANASGVLNEEHVKVLKAFHLVQQTFECEICQKTCDKPEHLECHQWWSSPDENN